MAQIRDLDKTKEALKEINKDIKEVETLNAFLNEEKNNGYFDIAYQKHKVKIFANQVTNNAMNEFVHQYKEVIVKRVYNMAKENNIVLDEIEKQILGGN